MIHQRINVINNVLLFLTLKAHSIRDVLVFIIYRFLNLNCSPTLLGIFCCKSINFKETEIKYL